MILCGVAYWVNVVDLSNMLGVLYLGVFWSDWGGDLGCFSCTITYLSWTIDWV